MATIVQPTSSVWKHYHCKNSIDWEQKMLNWKKKWGSLKRKFTSFPAQCISIHGSAGSHKVWEWATDHSPLETVAATVPRHWLQKLCMWSCPPHCKHRGQFPKAHCIHCHPQPNSEYRREARTGKTSWSTHWALQPVSHKVVTIDSKY